MQTFQKITSGLLRRCDVTRFGLHLAYKMNIMRPYSKGPLSLEEFIEEVHTFEIKHMLDKHNNRAKLLPKPLEALLIALDAMAVLKYENGKVQWILSDEDLKLILAEIKDIDPLLMSCETLVLNAFRKGGPDAKTFMKYMKGIRAFETKMQDIIVKRIVKDIRGLYDEKKKELESKGKVPRKLRIVDIGCGEGKLDYALAKEIKCGEINACDTNQDVLDQAIENKPKEHQHLTFTKKPKWNKEEVDVVILINVLHDAVNPDGLIKEVSDLLHDDGIAIIVDPLVSTDRAKNFLNPQAVSALCMGFFGCVLSTDCNHAKGPATGKEELLKCIMGNGLFVKDQKLLAGSKFYHGFIVVKSSPLKKKSHEDVIDETHAMMKKK